MDGDKKRKREKTKAKKAGTVLPDCLLIPISWVSETLFACAVRHKYVLYRAWHSQFIFTHYSDSELE